MSKTIAVVGAGVSGAVCARQLATMGHEVNVFDKGRGSGGRVSLRRTDSGHRFEHGAARIEVSRSEIHELLAPAVAAEVVLRAGDVYTGPTGLQGLCKWLLNGLPSRFGTKVVRVERGNSWSVVDALGASYGPFDAVVLAVPPVNAAEAVTGQDAGLAKRIASVRMLPRWVAMLTFHERLRDVPDRSTISGHLVRRSLPNTVGDALVIEASEGWSVEQVELDAIAVAGHLLDQVRPVLGGATPTSVVAHRWRYAFAEMPLGEPYLTDGNGLFVCGDWCLGTSIESACLSAASVVEAIGSH